MFHYSAFCNHIGLYAKESFQCSKLSLRLYWSGYLLGHWYNLWHCCCSFDQKTRPIPNSWNFCIGMPMLFTDYINNFSIWLGPITESSSSTTSLMNWKHASPNKFLCSVGLPDFFTVFFFSLLSSLPHNLSVLIFITFQVSWRARDWLWRQSIKFRKRYFITKSLSLYFRLAVWH